ncbi:hypothetical protein PQX77_000969 [Marasmius sp. AFHP31]|nr:hypothetical protein PQX77_000969 [Marasmius sp. AFHP31]
MIDTNAQTNPGNSHLQFEQRKDEWIEYRKSATEVTPNQSLQFNAKWSHLKETVHRDEETETAVNTEDEHENAFEPTSPSSRDHDREIPSISTRNSIEKRPTFPSFLPTFLLGTRKYNRTRTKKSSIARQNKVEIFNMAPKTYTWISLWFLITIPVIFWDVGFCFMRPRSFEGGDMHWYWTPYSIYQNVDLVYGVEAYKRGDGFANAQSLLNVIETLLNALYLYAAHVTAWPPATLIGFTSASLTLAKTVLYWAQEYYCSYCAVGHNDVKTLILYWIIPNGLWIVIPSAITYTLGKDLAAQLNYADKAAKLAKLQKGR